MTGDPTMGALEAAVSDEARPVSLATPIAPTAMSLLAAVGGAQDDAAAIAVAADLARRHRWSATVVNTFEPAPSAVMRSGYAGAMVGMRAWRLLEEERRDITASIRRLVDEYAIAPGANADAPDCGSLRVAPASSTCWATLMR